MKFQIVVLDNAWENWSRPGVMEFFLKIITLKNQGYRKEYPQNVMSVDGTDFFGTHHVVCATEPAGNLVPLMAYKSVALSRAARFSQPFGGLSLVRSVAASDHERAVKTVLELAAQRGHAISYDSSWTIAPAARDDRDLTLHLREIMMAMHVLYHTHGGPEEVVAGGSTRFKMERLYEYWGYERLSCDGKALPPLNLPAYAGEEILVFHAQKFSSLAISDAKRFLELWESRLEIGTTDSAIKKAA